jgi:hypothetical protein
MSDSIHLSKKQLHVQQLLYLFVLGLWLHESGVLGASPDGLVQRQPHLLAPADMPPADIIEVKCPSSARESTVMQAATEVKDFFLSK